jgi:DNA helicase II / ATP-dependent DNA helicase PcrA
MRLSREQRDAVRHDSNTLIVACPGSGKTRTLVAKLLHCLDEVRGTSRRIACVTYTNAAVYEIEDRLRTYGTCGDEDYCDVSTIHSFCLVNILSPFFWRIPEYGRGFSVVTPDSDFFQRLAADVLAENGIPTKFREYFEQFNREPDGTPIVPPELDTEIALSFWERLQAHGLIDFPNIIYHAYRLIADHPSIAYALSCRYAWLLVDEFQDTTALQIEILRKIAAYQHTKFLLVGDPYQSIFGFAGARVELMGVFAREILAESRFRLTANYRSGSRIINHADRLCPREPPMHAAGETADIDIDPIYVHAQSAFEAITDYFLPGLESLGIDYGKAAILSPWWIKLLHLGRNLREYGIPIVGPGARPYKKSHLYATLAEQLCAYITHPTRKTFHQIEKELFILANALTGSRPYSVFSYEGNVTIRKLIDLAASACESNPRAVEWLAVSAEAVGNVLCEARLVPACSRGVLTESANEIIKDLIKNKVDIDNLSAEGLGLFASTDRNLHLLTMHKAKGREFDAVAIVDLHDGRVPDFRAINNNDLRRIEEDKRLLYVSITRARRFLMYITDEEDRRNRPSRFICIEHLDLPRYN